MNRLQTLVLVLWTLVVLLFVAFNWNMVVGFQQVSYLFMDFEIPLVMWLLAASVGLPIVVRLLATVNTRTTQKKSEKEIQQVKTQAFDGLSVQFEKMTSQLQENLEKSIQKILDSHESQHKSASSEEPVSGDQVSKEKEAPKADA